MMAIIGKVLLIGLAVVGVALIALMTLGWYLSKNDPSGAQPGPRCPDCGERRETLRSFAGGWVRLEACDNAFSDRFDKGCTWVLSETHSHTGERSVRIGRHAAHTLGTLPEEEVERRVARISLWGPRTPSRERIELLILTPSDQPVPHSPPDDEPTPA